VVGTLRVFRPKEKNKLKYKNMGRGFGSYIKKADRDYLRSLKFCFYCSTYCDSPAIEHIHPLYEGGNSHISNLTTACTRCNSLKGTYTLNEFFERINNKRAESFDKAFKYSGRLKRSYKRRENRTSQDIDWLINKIKENRALHSYYTRIINSLTHKTYIINGEAV